MIETLWTAWAGLLAVAALASGAGLGLSAAIPWHDAARRARLPLAGGLLLAPFLTGLATVLVLHVLPGALHSVHVALVAALLASICLLSVRRSTRMQWGGSAGSGSPVLRILLALWCVALLINASFLPLTQNDSLEYATVGRLLFTAGTLDAYPAIDAAHSLSGFYGPWTHPPLYVSLIYLASAIQGHANEPGLMRLIAPWFLLCATAGVVALGTLRRHNVGLLAGLLFISTPGLFLGADSALIDALPVGGMVLLMLVLAGLKHPVRGFGVWLGLALGLALWTHSQAILFVPLLGWSLLLLRGVRHWRVAATDFALALLVAVVLTGWPYLKNIAIFGSPISDNPAVFALKELDWQGYFRYARGLDSWSAIFQYGVLKGWFVPEAYALNFWLLAIGLVVFWGAAVRGNLPACVRNGIDGQPADLSIVWLAAGLIVAYLAGVVLSTILGIDLMIRNDRYLLLIAPAVAIGAGYGMIELGPRQLRHLADPQGSIWRAEKAFLFFWGALTLALSQLAFVGWYYRWKDAFPASDASAFAEGASTEQTTPRLERILGYWSSFRAMQEMPQVVPNDALVLTMRPADMYYSGRKMLSYLDPRLLPVYSEPSAALAAKQLQALGVGYVHLVDYSLPSLYNSVLQEITSRPDLSKLEYRFGTTQIYSLRDSGLREGPSVDITPGKVPWSRTPLLRLGGKKIFNAISMEPRLLAGQETSVSAFPLFQRDYSVELATTVGGALAGNADAARSFKVDPELEYLLTLQLEGRGFVRIWVQQFDARGLAIDNDLIERSRPMRIGELSLTERYPQRVFSRRLKLLPGATRLRFSVEHVGQSRVTVTQATLSALVPSGAVLPAANGQPISGPPA